MEILTALCIQKIKVRLLFAVFFNVESQKLQRQMSFGSSAHNGRIKRFVSIGKIVRRIYEISP